MIFDTLSCLIEHKASKDLVFKGYRIDNVYMLDLDDVSMYGTKCLATKGGDSWLWHRRLSLMHFDLIKRITSKNVVFDLPKINFSKDKLCDAFQIGKQMRVSFKLKKVISASKPLELLHLDLFGPSWRRSLVGNYYGFLIVDHHSRFTWPLFLTHRVNLLKLSLICLSLSKIF